MSDKHDDPENILEWAKRHPKTALTLWGLLGLTLLGQVLISLAVVIHGGPFK